MGILRDDQDHTLCLREAATFMTGSALRQMFATILSMNPPANPQSLFLQNAAYLSDNCAYALRTKKNVPSPSEADIQDLALALIERSLRSEGKILETVGLSRPNQDIDRFFTCMEDGQEEGHNSFEPYSTELKATLTDGQATIFDKISNGLEANSQTLMYLDGLGGSGKTYLLNAILGYCDSIGSDVMAVSSSGISALLLQNGRTAHKALGIPLACNENSTCSWSPCDSKPTKLSNLCLLVWDKISMQHRYAVEAVNRSLQDLKKNKWPFGGISVLFSGDFLQILPVIKKGNIYDQARASLKHSPIWAQLQRNSLSTNMRLNINAIQRNCIKQQENIEFSNWLLCVGEGQDQAHDTERIPILHTCTKIVRYNDTACQLVIDWVYKDITKVIAESPAALLFDYYANRSIITALNLDVGQLNDTVLGTIKTREMISTSIDKIVEDSPQAFGEEILHSMNHAGFPTHVLKLKISMTLMLLRNLNVGAGLCNGTRLLLEDMKSHVLKCVILTSVHRGQRVLIPKINLVFEDDNDFGVSFNRYQFPVTPAFAMTINKSQGQGFERVGIYLPNPIFSHGQLYVALSRTKNLKDILLAIVDNGKDKATYNVVCKSLVKE